MSGGVNVGAVVTLPVASVVQLSWRCVGLVHSSLIATQSSLKYLASQQPCNNNNSTFDFVLYCFGSNGACVYVSEIATKVTKGG